MDQQEWSSPSEPHQTLEHLNRTHNLQSLDMALIDMSDVEAKQIGEAVASHANKSLEVLTLKLDSEYDEEKKSSPTSMWPMDSFLTAAFLEQPKNTSIRSLVIASSGTDGDIMRLGVLPQVIQNTGFKELVFQWHGDDGASREEIRELLEAIKRNATIESLALPNLVRWDFLDPEDQDFIDAESFAQVVELVEHNTSIHKLELHIGECRGKGADAVNLDAFYGALSSNSTIRSLCLKGPFCTPIAETQFSNWLRTTSSLQELQLEGDGDESPVPKLVFQALRDNKSLRKLEMEDFVVEDEDLDVLMNSLKVNSTLQEIVFHPECDREDDVREALKKNLEQ